MILHQMRDYCFFFNLQEKAEEFGIDGGGHAALPEDNVVAVEVPSTILSHELEILKIFIDPKSNRTVMGGSLYVAETVCGILCY